VSNAGRVGKNCVFRLVEKSLSQTPYRRKFVSILRGALNQRRWAGGEIRGAEIVDHSYGPVNINNVCCSGSLLITRTAHFSITCMWHGASHARCAIVEPTTTMRVWNYTGSEVKRESCWKCSSGWHLICLRYLCNNRATFPLIQSVVCLSHNSWASCTVCSYCSPALMLCYCIMYISLL